LDGSTYYIFEFVDGDLCKVVKQNPQGLDETRAAELTRQLFAGLAHMHQHNFFHRDIKPENILFETTQGSIRIADFGEARSLRARPPFTDYVGTRWYRAPECLLRDRTYSSPVDVWAAGLVLAELLRGSPVLCGSSSIDQLCKIIAVLGDPYSDWPEFVRLAGDMRFRIPEEGGYGWKRLLPHISTQAVGILNEILILNPRRRPPARRVMDNVFFAELPPLDLPDGLLQPEEKPHRDSQASRPSGIGEERPRSMHNRAPVSPAPVSPEDKAHGPRPSIGLPIGPSHSASSPMLIAEVDERDPVEDHALEALEAPTPDIDLDAELDKILGTVSPRNSMTPQDMCPLPPGWPEVSITGLTGLSMTLGDDQPLQPGLPPDGSTEG
jgi:serine/threonine protein kinase